MNQWEIYNNQLYSLWYPFGSFWILIHHLRILLFENIIILAIRHIRH